MKIHRSPYNFELTHADLESIKRAIRLWGKSESIATEYSGALLHKQFEMWEHLIDSDWANWDISEYNHDIGCRAWIQIAIEHSGEKTKASLTSSVNPLDDLFKKSMKPIKIETWQTNKALAKQPYFWESHSIYPEL